MSEQAKIHFKNEPFMAVVVGKGGKPIKCIPVVYDEFSNCGLGVYFEDGSGMVWGMVCPRNLIAAWRGTEVLRRLGQIESSTLCHAYYTGLRNPHESDRKRCVDPTIEIIGHRTYKDIMSMQVPDQIIRAILDNQKTEDGIKPDLWPITDEVRAGTIQWRQEFADAGIKHPDEIDAEEKKKEEIIAHYEWFLKSIARSRGLSRDCLGMGYIEGAVIGLVKKGANKSQPDHVVVALAGVAGELACNGFAKMMLPFGCDQKILDANFEKEKQEAINDSARWLSSTKKTRVIVGKRLQPSYSYEEAKSLLSLLLEQYYPSAPAEANATA